MHYILHRLCVQSCRFCAVPYQKLLSTLGKQHFILKKFKQKYSEQLLNSSSVLSEIRNCLKLNEEEYFIKYIPKNLMRKSNGNRTLLYLINPDVAKKFSSMISKDLQKNNCFIIECNPGLGLLTRELLKAGIPSIHIYENNSSFLVDKSPLSTLLFKYKTRLHLTNLNFFDIWLRLLHDKRNKDSLSDIYLKDTPYHSWKHNTFTQIISVSSDRAFLSLLIHNFINQTSIFDHGRPTFYMGLPSSVWKHFTVTNASDANDIRYYTHYNVILYLFFEFHFLGELPGRAFLPWRNIKSGMKNNETIVVIKIEPKINTFKLIKKSDLVVFWFFLKHCMKKKKSKVMTELEKFSPGCGLKLIEQDIDICTSFKELEPKKLLTLFKRMKTWPEYNENIFLPNLEFADEIKKEDDKLESEEEQEENLATEIKT